MALTRYAPALTGLVEGLKANRRRRMEDEDRAERKGLRSRQEKRSEEQFAEGKEARAYQRGRRPALEQRETDQQKRLAAQETRRAQEFTAKKEDRASRKQREFKIDKYNDLMRDREKALLLIGKQLRDGGIPEAIMLARSGMDPIQIMARINPKMAAIGMQIVGIKKLTGADGSPEWDVTLCNVKTKKETVEHFDQRRINETMGLAYGLQLSFKKFPDKNDPKLLAAYAKTKQAELASVQQAIAKIQTGPEPTAAATEELKYLMQRRKDLTRDIDSALAASRGAAASGSPDPGTPAPTTPPPATGPAPAEVAPPARSPLPSKSVGIAGRTQGQLTPEERAQVGAASDQAMGSTGLSRFAGAVSPVANVANRLLGGSRSAPLTQVGENVPPENVQAVPLAQAGAERARPPLGPNQIQGMLTDTPGARQPMGQQQAQAAAPAAAAPGAAVQALPAPAGFDPNLWAAMAPEEQVKAAKLIAAGEPVAKIMEFVRRKLGR